MELLRIFAGLLGDIYYTNSFHTISSKFSKNFHPSSQNFFKIFTFSVYLYKTGTENSQKQFSPVPFSKFVNNSTKYKNTGSLNILSPNQDFLRRCPTMDTGLGRWSASKNRNSPALIVEWRDYRVIWLRGSLAYRLCTNIFIYLRLRCPC